MQSFLRTVHRSNSGGNWFLGSCGAIGISANNNPLESYHSTLKADDNRGRKGAIRLNVSYTTFLNEESVKLVDHDCSKFIGTRHGHKYNMLDGHLNIPQIVLAIAALMSFDLDCHEYHTNDIYNVNAPSCVGVPKSELRVSEYKTARSNPSGFNSVTPTEYFFMANMYCCVKKMKTKDGDKVYEGNPLRKLYQCECWMSHMWGICPAIIVVANHEGNMRPALNECFKHFNVSSNTFDSKNMLKAKKM